MEDVVDAAGEVDEVGDVVVDEFEVFVAGEMGDVVGIARDEVVDGDDVVALGEEAVDEMGAEEAGAAGDDGDGSGGGGCHAPECFAEFAARGNKNPPSPSPPRRVNHA